MTGGDYRNKIVEKTLVTSTGKLKCHYILTISFLLKKYVQMIDLGDNIFHGTIGAMSCCNNGIDSLGVGIFI